MRLIATCIISLFFCFSGFAQQEDVKRDLERAKAEMKKNNTEEKPDYVKAGKLLEKVVAVMPDNPEAWYFYGYAIDRYNSASGETIPNAQLSLTQKASEAFEKAIKLSNDQYKGERLVLDPHTKILTVWGSQALRYQYEGKKDSSNWCLREAYLKGGINNTALQYFRQVLSDCSKNAYLFTNGDMYLYYFAYLQSLEHFRNDVTCIDLNLLNTKWYPQSLVKKNILPLSFSPEDLQKLGMIKWEKQDINIPVKTNSDSISVITWNLPPSFDQKFLLRSDRILLDFLQHNAFRSNVFFANDVPQEMYLFLDDYLQFLGLTYKLVPKKNSTDIDELAVHLRELKPLPENAKNYLNNPDNIQVLNNYRFAYAIAAQIALNKKRYDKALQLIEAEERKYPESVLPFFAEATKKWYYQLKEEVGKKQPVQ